jgi:RimJ/RimL family protein N-acetyltransferase
VTLAKSIALRLASKDDCRQLFEWRNDPTTVAMSLVSVPVAWDDHVRWFESVLANPTRHLLVATDGEERFGTVRFDDIEDTAEISITVSPEKRGQGVGGILLELSADWAKRELGLDRILAQIKESNPASIAIFKKAGYQITNDGEVLSLVKFL